MASAPSTFPPLLASPLARNSIAFRSLPVFRADVIVVGSGVAGLAVAISAADAGSHVMVLSKGRIEQTNTNEAQGGIAAAVGDDDSTQQHADDTYRLGYGLSDRAIVDQFTAAAPEAIEWLIQSGMQFDYNNDQSFDLGREAGHRAARILHSAGTATGREMQRTLVARAKSHPRIDIYHATSAVELLKDAEGAVRGLIAMTRNYSNRDFETVVFEAPAVVMATGGGGQIFRETTNPQLATADGLAMSLRAGAELRDLEFVQFHPTILYLAGAARFLISEVTRGAGAKLRDKNGVTFMDECHPDSELAPRDVVSRAIFRRMVETHARYVSLDLSSVNSPAIRFPELAKICNEFGIDIEKESIPVRPAAHYLVGGIKSNLNGQTTVPGLFAVGECASTGFHGANRMGSNSLLEGLVHGRICGQNIAKYATAERRWLSPRFENAHSQVDAKLNLNDMTYSLKSLMWSEVGIQRNANGLDEAQDLLNDWEAYLSRLAPFTPQGVEVLNMVQVAQAITRCASYRTESRGAHYRDDYPQSNDEFKAHTCVNTNSHQFVITTEINKWALPKKV
ncbi:MAG: L-aspartate oxidase [Planctomycetes bacterium]|nr:L-aspartate oxidase [Planctomycetota bacterium]